MCGSWCGRTWEASRQSSVVSRQRAVVRAGRSIPRVCPTTDDRRLTTVARTTDDRSSAAYISPMPFGTIEQAIADIKAGKLIIVADDEDRENEGDLVCAAQLVTPELINFMITHARGWVCLPLTGERCDQLELPPMSEVNTEEQRTAFTVSIDAGHRFGVTTGISAQDRAKTVQVAVDSATIPSDLRRPGHIHPLRARQGGVLQRVGHTEAAVDLAHFAG